MKLSKISKTDILHIYQAARGMLANDQVEDEEEVYEEIEPKYFATYVLIVYELYKNVGACDIAVSSNAICYTFQNL